MKDDPLYVRSIGLSVLLLIVGGVAFAWVGSDGGDSSNYWMSVPKEEMLDLASRGEVLFIDTREPEEYAESHIPGAINAPGRDIDEAFFVSLGKYEYIVPYCMKDFRGYEAARKLRALGADNVRLIEGFGLNAWKQMGLPLVKGESGEMENDRSVQAVLR